MAMNPSWSPLYVKSGPSDTGNVACVDVVEPTTYALPAPSTARAKASPRPVPPMNPEYTRLVPLGLDLGHERVAGPALEGQVRPNLHRVVGRLSAAGDIRVAGGVDRDPSWLLEPRTAEVAEIVECRAR